MLYKEFLLRLAELVEESEDHSFYLCVFCFEVKCQTSGGRGNDLGESTAVRKMLQEYPQWLGCIVGHAAALQRRIKAVERRYDAFSDYAQECWPTLCHNAQRVAWLREEAAKL